MGGSSRKLDDFRESASPADTSPVSHLAIPWQRISSASETVGWAAVLPQEKMRTQGTVGVRSHDFLDASMIRHTNFYTQQHKLCTDKVYGQSAGLRPQDSIAAAAAGWSVLGMCCVGAAFGAAFGACSAATATTSALLQKTTDLYLIRIVKTSENLTALNITPALSSVI